MRRLFVSLSILALIASGLLSSGVAQPSAAAMPIAFTIAVGDDGTPVVTEEWLVARMHQADLIFAPAELAFVSRERASMDATYAHMENRSDRHGLATMLVARSINVFVVASLRDVDDPSLMRQGVHWRSPRVPGSHYVILSAVAAQTTLAHELGHFYGNPHSPVVNNIMSYERDGTVVPFFDERQLRRIRSRSRRYLRSGEIAP